MKAIVSIVAVALLAGCSAQQDAKVQTELTKINGEIAVVKQKVMDAIQATCPQLVNAMPTVEIATAVVATAIGLPATGTAIVGLETATAKGCQALLTRLNSPNAPTPSPTLLPLPAPAKAG